MTANVTFTTADDDNNASVIVGQLLLQSLLQSCNAGILLWTAITQNYVLQHYKIAKYITVVDPGNWYM